MTLLALDTQDLDSDIAAAQRQARIDLAAAHRIAVMHDFHEGIFNHLTLAVPGRTDRYYQIPFGLHWSEVTASCFMEVGYDGRVLAGSGEVERSAFCIHAPIHRLVPEHACVLHTHMPYASALARLEEPEIQAIGQTEIGFLDKIAYDHDYTGPALDPAEGERLAGIIGSDKKILFMANHGVAVCGTTVAEAYDLLYYLERACQVQLYAMWTGRKMRQVRPEIVSHTLNQYQEVWPNYGNKPTWQHHFDALKRILDRREPDYID
jgi:ribulose-5-phosphate 4-epimerase/fuculose-1-phosphate aldolase